jgi:hypothetical protein
VHSDTTVADCLVVLNRELGLPTSTLDLVGPGSRSKGSQSGGGDTAICWDVRLGNPAGERLGLDKRIMDVAEGMALIHVSIDEEWLYELTPGHSPAPVSGPCDTDKSEEKQEEDKEDTLKAASPRRRTAILAKEMASPHIPGQARLSGLFHAWVDTNQHPAPPPTPQLTLVGGEGTAALAGLLHEGLEDQLTTSPRQTPIGDGTPGRASGHEPVGSTSVNWTTKLIL